MEKYILMTLFAMALIACDRQKGPADPATQGPDAEAFELDYDNTGINVRDRDLTTKTPLDQSESEADLIITKKIRQAIISDGSLSIDAKNIKIITINGVTTLRGPVESLNEKEAILQKINDVEGINDIDNQLEIIRKHH